MWKNKDIANLSLMLERWVPRFFFILLLCIPFTRRFSKIFRSFFESIIPSDLSLPSTFDWHQGMYIADFPFLFLMLGLIFLGRFSWRLWTAGSSQRFLSLFLTTVFLSILFSSTPAYLIHYFRFIHLLLPCMLFYFLSEGKILGDRKALLSQAAKVIVIMAVFESLVCVGQYFSQQSVGLKYFGEPPLTSRHVAAPSIVVSDGSLTIFDHWLGESKGPKAIIRAVGTLYHPNICGGFLVFGLLFSYMLFLKADRKRWISLAIFLQVLALFLTFSRAALYAWVMATALWFFFLKLKEKKLAFLLPACAIFCLILFYPQLADRGGVVSYTETARSSDLARLEYQRIAGTIMRDHPLLGIGFDHYLMDGYYYVKRLGFDSVYLFNFVHNIFLFIGAENGFLGLGFFLAFIGTVIKQGWSARKETEGATLMALFLCFIFLGSCDIYLFMSQIGRWMLFFTAGGLISLAPKPAAARVIVVVP